MLIFEPRPHSTNFYVRYGITKRYVGKIFRNELADGSYIFDTDGSMHDFNSQQLRQIADKLDQLNG